MTPHDLLLILAISAIVALVYSFAKTMGDRESDDVPEELEAKMVSSYPGISWDKEEKKWRVRKQVNGRIYHLGRYKDHHSAVARLLTFKPSDQK